MRPQHGDRDPSRSNDDAGHSRPDAGHRAAGAPTLGRAGPAAPLRREGPAKLTGLARYTDDLVFPGAQFGATIRRPSPRGRLLGIDLDPAFDWGRVTIVTAADIPGDNVVAGIADDQPILVPVGGEIRHQAEPLALLAAADRQTLREACRHVERRPVDEVRTTLPNLHHRLVDLGPFGLTHDGEIFVATAEPHGLIEAPVRRASA